MSGSEYLDKIIHLPFCIPVASNKDRLRLVKRWLNHDDDDTQRDNGREAKYDDTAMLRLWGRFGPKAFLSLGTQLHYRDTVGDLLLYSFLVSGVDDVQTRGLITRFGCTHVSMPVFARVITLLVLGMYLVRYV